MMKNNKDELLDELCGLEDNSVERISEMVDFLDDDALERIEKKCFEKMGIDEQEKDVINTENNNKVEGVEIIMKKRFNKGVFVSAASVAVVVGVIGAFALTNKTNRPEQSIMSEQSPATAVTESVTEAVQETTEATAGIQETTLSIDELINAQERNEANPNSFHPNYDEEVKQLFDGLINKDSEAVADVIGSQSIAVASWINNIEIESYEIIGTYSEPVKYWFADEYEDINYTLIKVNTKKTYGDALEEGEHLYKYIGIDGIIPDEKTISEALNYGENIGNVYGKVLSYSDYIDLDFDNMEEMLESGKTDIKTLETTASQIIDGDADWDTVEGIKENICKCFDLKPENINDSDIEAPLYELSDFVTPIKFSRPVSATDNNIIIDYYSDRFGFDKMKTVEYTYSKNDDGSIKLLSAHSIWTIFD